MKSAIIACAVLILCVGACIVSAVDAVAEHGKQVYAAQKCAMCHSISGAGGKRLALDGVGSRLKPKEMQKWIRTPKEMKSNTTMKAYPNLPEKDLDALTSYLLSLK
ncbi:MAG: cytochrome c [Acidobacteria bacterium]|nr:cytochrome c [Acidobacteriota bacterium]